MKDDKMVGQHKRIAMGSQTDGTHLKHGGKVEGAKKRTGGSCGYKKGGKVGKK